MRFTSIGMPSGRGWRRLSLAGITCVVGRSVGRTLQRLSKVLAGLALFCVSACSVVPAIGLVPLSTSAGSDAAAAEEQAAEQAIYRPTDNPYLASAVEVDEAAIAKFEQALQAMREQNSGQAEVLLRQLTQSHPQLSGPFFNLGLLYRNSGQQAQAQKSFRQALTANPNNLEAYNQLAIIKREQGDFKAAENYYRAALDIWPQHPQSHRNLGILYELYLGRLDDALHHYRQYLLGSNEEQAAVLGWVADIQRRVQEIKGAEPFNLEVSAGQPMPEN